jgi:gliding motility-associated-like protein
MLCRMQLVYSQTPAVVISSYYNAGDPRDDWSELLVVADDVNMTNWVYQDNNATQTFWQPAITFSNPVKWDHMRAGTIIIIWHRSIGSDGVAHPIDSNKDDGFIEVSANDPNYFSGGDFGTAPFFAGTTLNIDQVGDLFVLQDASSNFVHALGHKSVYGASWSPLPLPKLNFKAILPNNSEVCVCPGASLDEYGFLPPQDGTTWTSSGSPGSFGLPNFCNFSSTPNSDFWRSLRQPIWNAPSMTGSSNHQNTSVTLHWNAAVDPYPADGTLGYLVLRNKLADNFSTPMDGYTYAIGENLGGATVIGLVHSPQADSCVDYVVLDCQTGAYYRVYPFRYTTDDANGNNFNVARGSAYNENSYASTHVTSNLNTLDSCTSDRNNFCPDDPGQITLSAYGGDVTEVVIWYAEVCGGVPLGAGTGANNSINISSPTVSTWYYANMHGDCGVSSCDSVFVTVIPDFVVSVSIIADQNPVCTGQPVTLTAMPVNEGTSPVYEWFLNGVSVQLGNSPVYIDPSYRFVLPVQCKLTSSLTCVSSNPVESPPFFAAVYPLPNVKITSAGNLCAGDSSRLDAGADYSSYVWQDGSTGRYYNAANEGSYKVTVTDSLGCSGSDSVKISICEAQIYVPTVFTPNGDGINDEFTVVSSEEGITSFSMVIYDRWGKLMFQTNDIKQGWNGSVNGVLSPAGSYAWKIEYQIFNQSTNTTSSKTRHGTIMLLR